MLPPPMHLNYLTMLEISLINSREQLPFTKLEPGAHRQPEPNTLHIPSDEHINLGAVPSSGAALLAQLASIVITPVVGATISGAETKSIV
jgi:hypothetical protein